jgi:hypothetical protein
LTVRCRCHDDCEEAVEIHNCNAANGPQAIILSVGWGRRRDRPIRQVGDLNALPVGSLPRKICQRRWISGQIDAINVADGRNRANLVCSPVDEILASNGIASTRTRRGSGRRRRHVRCNSCDLARHVRSIHNRLVGCDASSGDADVRVEVAGASREARVRKVFFSEKDTIGVNRARCVDERI